MNPSLPSAPQRAISRITLLLLLLVACSALGAWAWEHMQRTRLEDRLAELESEATSRAMRPAEHPKPGDRRVVLKGKAAAQEGGTDGETDSAKAPGTSGGTQDAAGEMAAGFAKMMATNPKMREMLKSQFRAGIDFVYRDLYGLLDLKEPQRSILEKLIKKKGSIGLEAALDLMDGNKTAEDRKAAAAEVKAKMAELDGQIKDLLGKEDYEKMTRYEDSTLERQQLTAFDTMLKSKDMRLDESTEARLMDVMYREREKFPFIGSYMDHRNPDILRFTVENSARFSSEYAQVNESIAKQAASLLPAEQLEVFRESQEHQMNAINMELGVAARMFSGADNK
jgi:hypothetical protein